MAHSGVAHNSQSHGRAQAGPKTRMPYCFLSALSPPQDEASWEPLSLTPPGPRRLAATLPYGVSSVGVA